MQSSATMSCMMRKKELLPRYQRIIFSRPVPAVSSMNETAALPLSPVADDPSALPSPTSSPSSSQQLFLPVHSMLAPVCQLLYCVKVKALVTQSCLTLCDPMDCSPLGSFVPGILQARILEWVAIPFCRGSS